MIIKTTGVLVDGKIELDLPLELPERSHLSVTIQPLAGELSNAKRAWESYQGSAAATTDPGRRKAFLSGRIA